MVPAPAQQLQQQQQQQQLPVVQQAQVQPLQQEEEQQQPPQRPTHPVVQPEAAETPGVPVAKQEQAKPEEPKPAAGADAIVEEEVDDKMAKEEKQGSSVQDK